MCWGHCYSNFFLFWIFFQIFLMAYQDIYFRYNISKNQAFISKNMVKRALLRKKIWAKNSEKNRKKFFQNFQPCKKKNSFDLKSKSLRLWASFWPYINPIMQNTHLMGEAISTNWASERWRVC